jgi:hypothetical protein
VDRPVLRAAGRRALFASAVTVLVLALHTVHVRTAAVSGASHSVAGIGTALGPTSGPSTHALSGPATTAPTGPRPIGTSSTSPSAPATAAAATAAVAAAGSATATATRSTDVVLVVGDSLALGSAPYLHTAFRPATVVQDLREGRGTAEGARVVAAHRSSSVIVASLGTNDDPRTQIFKPAADALVAAAHGRCLVWATVERPGDVDGTRWTNVNAIIRDEAAAHPNVVVVDWAGEQAAHPSWIEGDAVHLTDAGYRARAAALASGVTRCD